MKNAIQPGSPSSANDPLPASCERFDVAVVGSGPAGSTCALHLARAGLQVAVLEKSAPPRYKTCGGGLIGRVRKLVDFDLAEIVEHECRVAEMTLLDANLCFRVQREEPLISMTMRAELDRRLLGASTDAGAELVTPCELFKIDTSEHELELRTSRGVLRARYAVAADGALSRTARAAGWGENPHGIPALESEIRVDPTAFERFRGCARFDFGVLPNGYAWLFPKREHLSVGCLSTARGAPGLKGALEQYLQHLGLGEIETREDHGFVIPIAPRAAVLARDRVLLTGDAAGLADPLTCEGITHAIVSGRLAAEALAGHVESPRSVCDSYHRAIAREILPELRIARLLARLLYDRPRLRFAVFVRVGQALCEAVADIVAGRQSYSSLFYESGNYLKLIKRMLIGARGSYVAS